MVGPSHTAWCLQAGGLERQQSQHFRQPKDALHYSLDDDALHGVVLVGHLGLNARGEGPANPRPAWLAAACEISMGDDW